MRVLVTGGAGYIGCILVPMLLEAGHQVTVLDSFRKGGLGLLPWAGNPNLEVVTGDVRDPRAIQEGLYGADVIMHLAAIVGYPACSKDPWLAQTTNVEGTINILQHRSPNQLVVYPSSLSNYGTVVGATCTEEMEPQPITLYGITKLESEKRLQDGENYIIFRPATAFGLSPQMRLDLLFNEFVFKAVKEKHLVVFQADYMRAFIHVHDFARAFLFALEHSDRMLNEVYNLGSEKVNLTKGDLAQRIRDQVPYDLQISEFGEDPDKRNYEVDFSKLRGVGFESEVGVEEGINELVRGYRILNVPNPFSNASNV